MEVIRNTKCVYVDVDDTLIFWDTSSEKYPTQDINGSAFGINYPLVDKLFRLKSAGYTIIVWSQGGGEWAEAVVTALGIESVVSLCVSKPMFYYDDLDCTRWMTKRIDPVELHKP